MKPDERGFEDAITTSLVEQGGYRVCKWGTKPEWAADFDAARGLDTGELFAFVEDHSAEGPGAPGRCSRRSRGGAVQFADRLAKQLDQRGTVDVLRHGRPTTVSRSASPTSSPPTA